MTVHATPLPSRLASVLLGLLGLALCAVLATYLAVRHVVWPRLDTWRPWLVEQVEHQLGRPVAIGALRPAWEGLHPSLEIDALRIDGADGTPRLEVGSAYARVSWRSLVRGQVRFAALRLDAPRLVVERLAPGRVAVAGFELAGDGPSDGRGLEWLLAQGELAAEGATIELVDRTGVVAPLRVEQVALQLRGTGRRHQASATIARPGDAAASLSAVVELYRAPLARPSDWAQWSGEAHVAGDAVDLARVAALADAFGVPLPGPARTAAGRLDALVWMRFGQASIVDATAKIRASDAVVRLDAGPLAFTSLAADARLRRVRDGGRRVEITGLNAIDAQGFALGADGDAELGLDAANRLRTAWLRLRSFDAGAALQAVHRLPLPAGARERLAGIGLAGDVRDLTLRWVGPDVPLDEARPADRSVDLASARPVEGRLEVTAAFDRLGLQLGERADGRRLPAFGNLSGTLRATDRSGTVVLSGRQATLAFPGFFEEPSIPFERLDGEVEWAWDPQTRALAIAVPRVAFANADARGTASGRWRSGGKWAGIVDVDARIERADARRIPRYLPSPLPEEVREWVRRSLLAGTAEDIRIEIKGDLYDFPFRDASDGRFRVAAAVRDGVLAYAPQWPRIEQWRGDVAFEGIGFQVRARSATSENVRLTDVVATLPDYRDAMLTIEGAGAGAAQDMLRFVNASPIATNVSAFTRELRVAGDARVALKLALPLKDLAATRVAGTVELPGNDVALDTTLPPFGGVTGRLEFTERGIALPELRGTLLGGPIRVTGRPAGEGRMRIDATGAIDSAGMRQLVDNPLTRRLEGRTDYRASVDVDRRASTVRIESDLVGLSSTLPAPFAKPAAEAWPLRVTSRPLVPADTASRPPGDRLDVRVRDTIALAVEREREAGGERLVIRRAGFAVDAEPVLRDGGLSVVVRTRAIDLDAWRAVLGDVDASTDARQRAGGIPLMPDLVSVVADDVRVGGRDLHEVVVGASYVDGRWRANVASREIEGHFDWREARPGERIGTLRARFARLVLPRSREREVESMLAAPPSRLPALDVVVDELVLGALPMGQLTLSATNGGTPARPVWTLDRLVVVNPAARLEARGTWSLAGTGPSAPAQPGRADARSTRLDFTLEVLDAGRLLDTMGLKETVNAGNGELAGSLHWQGSPLGIDFGSLDGDVRVALDRGEFLKVDPGAAKLIGVLNMQSLPKRLSGDFRDLFGEGFPFDTLAGQVRIDDGIARTDDLRIRGLQAQVRIRGEADLARETQRLNVEVVPQLNAGLASIAFGAMVNPLIGLGSFAAQYVLKKPIQDALAYDVDVTGSWSDPMVSERHRRVLAPRAPSNTP